MDISVSEQDREDFAAKLEKGIPTLLHLLTGLLHTPLEHAIQSTDLPCDLNIDAATPGVLHVCAVVHTDGRATVKVRKVTGKGEPDLEIVHHIQNSP